MNLEKVDFISVEREIKGRIMKTDVFVKVLGPKNKREKIETDVDHAFQKFQDFSDRFSRFSETSELTQFNRSTGGQVSPELYEILKASAKYYRLTNGIFDPSVLPILEQTGYHGASLHSLNLDTVPSFTELTFEEPGRVMKPLGLAIDLGGIGKGFIVDQVSHFLSQAGYADFVVDAGGDIFAAGKNHEEGYPYWAFDIEHPLERERSVATVLLSNQAVATSGRNRRTWQQEGKMQHHLIDPRQSIPASPELLTVSVVAPTTVMADIWAKTFFILGKKLGRERAEELGMAALLIDADGAIEASLAWDEIAWEKASAHMI